jgi:hypothetical protein
MISYVNCCQTCLCTLLTLAELSEARQKLARDGVAAVERTSGTQELLDDEDNRAYLNSVKERQYELDQQCKLQAGKLGGKPPQVSSDADPLMPTLERVGDVEEEDLGGLD